jgi:hypothetical protein
VEALLDKLRLHVRCKELIYVIKMHLKAAFYLYLISSFDEIVVSGLTGR